jgi:hypothetical protein
MLTNRYIITLLCCSLFVLSIAVMPISAQDAGLSYLPYDIGSPIMTKVYVSVTGSDDNDGATPATALRTLAVAWERIPGGETLTSTGYHILLLPGIYAPEETPNYWESRYGTAEYPIIIEAAEGADTVWLPSMNLFDVRYVYFLNLNSEPNVDVFHCERCDHVLLRGNRFIGANPDIYAVQETLKVNQSQYIYVENNDISGAWDNAVDFVAVQYGHFLGNRIHNSGDWCMYLKGGSAYFAVAGNEFYSCGVGGFTAGQGTGLQFMTSPWLQYEAYDIKVINNVIHDTSGAGLGVQGGYNILLAYNTLHRVGERSHLLEVGFGSRSCDGQDGDEGRHRCAAYQAEGGWGNLLIPDGNNYVRIPNQNVFIYNNLIVNPAGFRSAYQHFSIFAPYPTQADSNVPTPALADDNLQIRGNVIENGDSTMPLGIESNPDAVAGCQPTHPTCNEAQLHAENAINRLDAPLFAPSEGDYRLATSLSIRPLPIPDFKWSIAAPQGTLSNTIAVDFAGLPRSAADQIGAFAVHAPAVILIGSQSNTAIVVPTLPSE